MSRRCSIVPRALCLVLLFGCAKQPKTEERPTAAAPAEVEAAPTAEDNAREARNLFKSRCVVCHGEEGKGDGPGAAALNPKPRNFTDGAWQASVSDEQIHKTIVFGGAAVGKSPNMPGNPDLEAKAAVVDQLVKLLRSRKAN